MRGARAVANNGNESMINAERCAEVPTGKITGTGPVGRPLTRAVAIPKYAKKWWAGTGLNRRHQDFQSCALPTELPAPTMASRETRIGF